MKKMKHIYIASECSDGGIYHYILKENELIFGEKVDVDRPMYLTESDGRLYAVLRQPFDDNENSGICSWEIEADGTLSNQSSIQSTKGRCGCHLCVAYTNVYAANYFSGSIVCQPSGNICEHGENAHPHCVIPTPDGKYLAVADLALDKVLIYTPSFALKDEGSVPIGHGARHLCFSKKGDLIYCVNELGSTVTVFSYSQGKIKALGTYGQVSENDRQKTSAAAIRLDDNYLYISHRGLDKIEVFPIMEGGTLGLSKLYDCGGKTPRDILKVDSVMISANLESDTVTVMDCKNGVIGTVKQYLSIKRPLAVLAVEDKK